MVKDIGGQRWAHGSLVQTKAYKINSAEQKLKGHRETYHFKALCHVPDDILLKMNK